MKIIFKLQVFLVLITLSFLVCASQKILDIKVEGLNRVDPGLVFNSIPFEINDEINSIDYSETIKLLYQTGQFKDIYVEREGSTIIISLREKPLLYELNFFGTETYQPEPLKEALSQLNISSGLILDESDLERAEKEISDLYLSAGKYSANVRSEIIPLTNNRVNVNFYINEGGISRIKQIKFLGNKIFHSEVLLDLMELKITNYMSWWNKDDRYSKQILIGDIEKIRSFYMNSGYLDFKIESSTVSISKSKKDVFIAITVDEGKKYSFGNSRITGNIPEQINVDDLKDKVKLENGKTFNRSLVNESTQDISKLLGNYGYAFANVNALPNVNKEKLIVDFNINVDPGKMIYVRRVNIIGNSSTKDEVIRRELRQYESSWFSQEKIDISKQRITRTQFFESVNIETPTVPGTSDQVDLNIILKETNTGKFSIGAGVSSSEGVVGSLSVTQGNFLGTGNRVSTEISTGGINKVWSLSFLDPYWTTDGISRGFSVNYRDLDTKDLNTGDYATKSYGAGVNFGIPLDEFRRLTFGAEIDFTELDLKSNSPQGYKNYCADISGAGSLTCDSDSILFFTAWSDNTLNSPFIPTSGHKYTVNIDVTTPGLDLEYYKLQAKFEKFFPLSDSVSTKIKIGAGFADSYGDNAYPFFKNFRVGGKNSVRGFKEGAIGKKTYDANYGKNVTYGGKKMLMVGAETFFPVPFMKKSESFRLGIFAEGGAPFEDSINTSDMRYSVGLSALWVSSFGPLSVSLGFPVNDDANDQLEKFQFGMGSSF